MGHYYICHRSRGFLETYFSHVHIYLKAYLWCRCRWKRREPSPRRLSVGADPPSFSSRAGISEVSFCTVVTHSHIWCVHIGDEDIRFLRPPQEVMAGTSDVRRARGITGSSPRLLSSALLSSALLCSPLLSFALCRAPVVAVSSKLLPIKTSQ